MPSTKREIIVIVSTTDRFRLRRKFKTLEGAQKLAQKYVGETPEISIPFQYAVGSFGDCKVECDGARIHELFPKVSLA